MNICRLCLREYVYDYNKGHRLTECNSCGTNKKRPAKKLRCIQYKGGKCQRCGYDRCIRALTFHHRNSNEKKFSIGVACNLSWDRLKIELDKCDLLCFNCHMEEEEKIIEEQVHSRKPAWAVASATYTRKVLGD